MQAVRGYDLGTKAFELVPCPDEWKEPFKAIAGERREFFPCTIYRDRSTAISWVVKWLIVGSKAMNPEAHQSLKP